MKISEILNITRGFRLRIATGTAAALVRVIADLVFVAMSKKAVDIATGNTTGDLLPCIASLIGIIILELICSSVSSLVSELSEAAMKDKLQHRLFGRLLSATWRGREKFHSGDILSRLTDDCRVVAESLCRTVPTMLVAAFQLVAAFIFLWYFSSTLALTLFLLLPVFMLGGKIFYRRVRRYTQNIRDIESRLEERMQESLQHRILLLAYRRTAEIVRTVSDLHSSRYNYVRRRTNITVYSRTAVIAGFEAGYLAAFIWSVIGLRAGTVTFGLMTAYLQLAGQIQRPIAEIARLVPGLVQASAAFSRIEALDALPSETAATDSKEIAMVPVGISIQNVSFTYPDGEKPALNDFSHIFYPGTVTAVMGETGVGKSTLLSLILALLQPQEGRIDIVMTVKDAEKEIPVSVATRNLMAYVPQGNSLLSGTIRRNLLLGNPDATEKEMQEALHTAAADFVFDLGEGLDTPCGERGAGLSEGQAQRIAIARGLLRPGSILLLDEISASLDEPTEMLLMQRLTENRRSHTIILVTHRSTPARFCDTILHI